MYDRIATETTFVLNNFPKNDIIISTFLISITIGFYTMFVVAMVTKLKNVSWLCDFIAMETTFVLNNFPKANMFITTFLKETFIVSIIKALSVGISQIVPLLHHKFGTFSSKTSVITVEHYGPDGAFKKYYLDIFSLVIVCLCSKECN